jgi:formylglycine-generating enzyme required for sulfatase activity
MSGMKTTLGVSIAIMQLCALGNGALAQVPGRVFKDCADCPDMVMIPGDSFVMGGKTDPRLNYKPEPDEIPQRSVSVPSFALGKHEVTQGQWQALMGENPSDYIDGDKNLPVETVSWNEAKEFAKRLSAKTGKTYRLPTEAEWEYAARAGSSALFSFGDDVGALGQYAWYGLNSGGHIHPVGQKEPNKFGLHDMHGNVWEWVEDCYQPTYEGAPTDGSALQKAGACQRNNRGGSWVNSAMNLRSDHRHKMGAGTRGTFVGMRLARTLD